MEKAGKKILVIRFSSIGDIVLTSPVVRCLKTQASHTIHYLTKKRFEHVLSDNPYIDKIHTIERSLNEKIIELKSEDFDLVVDLHKNIRSSSVISKLSKPFHTFPKLNLKKWAFVNLKINLLPDIHIVDRYFEAVKPLKIINDHQGLDYFIPKIDKVNLSELSDFPWNDFAAIVIGGHHNTKIYPAEKVKKVCDGLPLPIILLGGPEDEERGNVISKRSSNKVFNACGKFNINQSASIINQASLVISNDTGLMHIAAAFRKKIISIWGNTVPEFGMYPYLSQEDNTGLIFEIKGLYCRPCSKIGYKKCPLGHFKCMKLINENDIVAAAKKLLQDKFTSQ